MHRHDLWPASLLFCTLSCAGPLPGAAEARPGDTGPAAERRAPRFGVPRGEQGLASSPLGFEGVGKVVVTLTDAPADYDAVLVTIDGVELHRPPQGEDRGGWLKVVSEPSRWDLLDLQYCVTATLGEMELPALKYDQVRVRVRDAAVVIDGEKIPLDLPDNGREGFILIEDMAVEADLVYELRIDFDADMSVVQGPRGWTMRPALEVDTFEPLDQD